MNAIAAISSPIGAGGIGIVRVSGKDALAVADAVFHIARKSEISEKSESGGARVSKNSGNCVENDALGVKRKDSRDCERDRADWEPLKMMFGIFDAGCFTDKGYAVFFPSAKSYTGEDTVEFYLHGGVRIMRGALNALIENGARLAERGEFTKLAYLSGRLSLSDAEGVADMINAESAAAVRAAYRLMNGGVGEKTDALADKLLSLITALEAALDYPEETEDEIMPALDTSIPEIIEEIDALLKTSRFGRIAKHGLTAVLAGETNAGKSSLLNALIGESRAIVTPVAGTTRDTIEASAERNGVKINFIDTAGLRESGDAIEREGIERAKRAIEAADVIIHVIDSQNGYSAAHDFPGKTVFTVYNKCDLTSFKCPRIANAFAVSAKTGENVSALADAIAGLYREGEAEGGEVLTSERHIFALEDAKRALINAYAHKESTVDCILIDLREAYDALGSITGRTASEDIIDSIFEKFCVGK